MKNDLTELVFILDRSGSMSGLESDTVGGFNALLEKQKRAAGAALVTTVLFSDGSAVLHGRLPVADVPPLTERDYCVGGCTALLDALGDTVGHIADIHKYARPEDVPAHTLVVVTTDGLENASQRFTAEQVRALVARQKERGWEFLFLGANIDAVETARRYGIDRSRAVNYHADGTGTRLSYEVVAEAATALRCNSKMPDDWSARVDADFRRRKKTR